MMTTLRSAIALLVAVTVLTGGAYPIVVTLSARVLFPEQATGCILMRDEVPVGASLIGQTFASDRYFWSRPSATATPHDAAASSGSNLGPSNPALVAAIRARAAALRARDPGNAAAIPVDLVTASGSGLDPHISPRAAFWQVAAVARARGMDESRIHDLVRRHVEPRTLGILGEPRVNVLRLNLALDAGP